MISATEKDRFKKAIVYDNSFCIKLLTGEDGLLANSMVRPEQLPNIVEIASKPFLQVVKPRKGQRKEKQFVIVLWHGCLYRVLNQFTKIY